MAQQRQAINIISELRQVTFPAPGEPKVVIALTYQADMGPPRTIWVDEDKVPDLAFLAAHPEAKEAPENLRRQGDEARRVAIRADLERRRAAPPVRRLEV